MASASRTSPAWPPWRCSCGAGRRDIDITDAGAVHALVERALAVGALRPGSEPATVALAPYVLLTEDFAAIRLDARAAVLVLIVGIVHTGVAYAMYFGSMKRLRAQTIALLSYIDPVFALLLSAAVLHEPITPLGLLGAALIIGSALVGEGRRQSR